MVLITHMDDTCTDTLSKQINTIQRLPLLKSFKPLLERLHSHADCHNRKLHYDHYASLLLLYFFNPTFTGLRSIQRASTLKNIQDKLGVKHASLGSLSEASHVFDPQLLTPIINELTHEVNRLPFHERFNNLDMTIVAVDGTLIKALPKMLWALWMDEDHRCEDAPGIRYTQRYSS